MVTADGTSSRLRPARAKLSSLPEQIENLSVISRGALELLRILPGVVAPDQSMLEIVSVQDGANNPLGYTVNGIRSTEML